MKNLPENESEYFELLGRIVKGAEYLDNPIITETDYTRGMKLYDELVDRATRFRFGSNL